MESGQPMALEVARSKEQTWFKRTIFYCCVVFLTLVGFIGAQYWVFSHVTHAIASTGDDTENLSNALFNAQIVSIAGVILLLASCLAFLISMIRWLLAIRARRNQSLGV